MGVFILFVYAYSTGAYFDDFFRCMCFLLLTDLCPLDTLTLTFCIISFVNLVIILLGAVV